MLAKLIKKLFDCLVYVTPGRRLTGVRWACAVAGMNKMWSAPKRSRGARNSATGWGLLAETDVN